MVVVRGGGVPCPRLTTSGARYVPHCSDAQTPRLLRPPWYIEFQDGNKLQGLRRTTLTCMHLADFVKTVPCSLGNSKELQDHSIDQYHPDTLVSLIVRRIGYSKPNF